MFFFNLKFRFLGIRLFIILILGLFFSCEKKQTTLSSKQTDSLSFYFSKVYNENLTIDTTFTFKSFELLKTKKNTQINRIITDSLTNTYFDIGDWDKYGIITSFYLKNCSEAKDTLFEVKALRHRGNYFFRKNIYDSSFYYYVKAEKIYPFIDDTFNYANILLKKGIVQCQVNDYLGASFSLEKSLILHRETKNYQKVYVALNQLGLIYREMKQFDRSIDCHNKALEIVLKYKLVKNNEVSNCLGNIGLVYEYQKDFNKANYYYQKSLIDKTIKKDNPILYATLIDNLAFSKIKLNNKTNLFYLLNESSRIRDSIDDKSFIVLSKIHFSEYYEKIANDTVKSIKFSKIAIDIAKKSKVAVDIVAALKQAAAVDKLNASAYTKDYIRINDSLQDAERKNLDRFARIQLETDEVMKENKALGDKNQNLVYYLIGFTVLALVGGLLFVIFRQRTKQKELLFLQSQQDANENIYQLLLEQQAKVAEVRQSEKTRIALELHDGIMNKLASIRLNLFVLSEKTDPATISKCLDHITDIQTIETEIRNVAHDLNQEVFLEKNSFKLLISEFVTDQNSNQKTQFNIEMDPQIDWEKINNTIKVNLFRIIQEATNNCNKHANATKAVIAFVLDENKICMSFIDNGIGADLTTTKEGIGIKNMNQRIKLLEGNISIKSDASTGTQIYLAVPIDKL